MMKMRCIVIDDEQTARIILKKYIQDVPFLELVKEFKNAVEALTFINNQAVDLIFLDIEMPKLSGLNFAKIIEQKNNIIFTTAHREFAVEGFELSAVDYLLKPFSFDRFLKAVQKTTTPSQGIKNQILEHIYVKVNKQMIKVNFDDLLYIEGLSNYVKIHTDQQTYVVYEKLSSLSSILPSDTFLRIHKSYIINTTKINLYTREYVEINHNCIPVSATYRNQFLDFLKG